MRAILLAALLLSSPAMAETITLTMGYVAEPYHMKNAFRTVRIGNPKILDAKPLSDHRLELQPLSPGTTDIAFYDENGNLIRSVGVIIQEQGLGYLEVVEPGKDRPRSVLYRCSSHGCEFVRASGLPMATTPDYVPRQEDAPPPAQTTGGTGSSPSFRVPQ